MYKTSIGRNTAEKHKKKNNPLTLTQEPPDPPTFYDTKQLAGASHDKCLIYNIGIRPYKLSFRKIM